MFQVTFGLCDGFEKENCTQLRNEFLRVYENTINPRNHSDFCISFLFTYRDFHKGTAGLASVGRACSARHNSGFVSFINYEQDRDFDETSITLIHEVAHTWGANHDQDYNRIECVDHEFIMNNISTSATAGITFYIFEYCIRRT